MRGSYGRRMYGLPDSQWRDIIVADHFAHAAEWARNELGPIHDEVRQRNDLFVSLPSGRVILFEVISHPNSLRGMRGVRLMLGAQGMGSELQHAMWYTWHRTQLMNGDLRDPELLCLAWSQEPLLDSLAYHEERRREYNEYRY